MFRTIRAAVLVTALLAFLPAAAIVGRAQQTGAPSKPDQAQTPATAQQQQPPQQQPPPQQQQGQQQQQPPQPTFKTGINFVRVDAIVSDKQGNPVKDLKEEDFTVTEDGKPQKIDSFKFINIGNATQQQLAQTEPPREIRNEVDEEREAAREDTRIFVIFLDDYHVRRGNGMAVRGPLDKFLQTQLGPNDLIAVMYPLQSVLDVQLTRDHEAVARAVEQFQGRKYDYTPRNTIEEQYANYPAETIERIRNQVTLSALKGLAIHLGGVREGRKSIVLVSEGFSNTLPPQLRDPVASMPGMGNTARDNPMIVDSAQQQSMNFFQQADLLADLQNVYDAANRANTAIYALDPRGLATSEFDVSQPTVSQGVDQQMLSSTQDTLRTLSNNTDGRPIMNRNDLATGLAQVVRDSSAYYLLGYNSSLTTPDGKFHEIKVRVRRPGVQVRARKGYWAPTAEDRARATAPAKPEPPPAVSKALSAIVEPNRGRVIRTWIGTSRGENGRTRVTFVWEPVPPAPGGDTQGSDRPARVSLMASGPNGQSYFRGRVPDVAVAANNASPAQMTGGAPPAGPSRVVFEAVPGKLQLRLSVEGTRAQVLDTDVRDIDIPDLTAPQVTLTTPAVYAARTARDFRALTTDPDAVPTPDREFSRTERLLIRFDAFGPGYTVPEVTAKLLNRTGQPMSDLVVKPDEKYPQEHSIDVPLASLAAGEYLVEIKAKSQAGEASQIVAMKITS